MSTPSSIPITRASSEGAGCYSCDHFLRCSLRLKVDAIIRDHGGWFDANGPSPAWQNIVYAVGEACTLYERKADRS